MSARQHFAMPPLVKAGALPLGAGAVRWARSSKAGETYAEINQHLDSPCVWEGGVRLAALLTDEPLAEPVCQRVQAEAERQTEDGGWPLSFADSVCLARACMTLCLVKGDKGLLQAVGRWLGWFGQHAAEILSDGQQAARMADVWELLEAYYDLTGKEAVLRLFGQLRQGGMDWTSALHTFSQQREMAAVSSFADLQTGMASPDADRAAHFRRLSALCHAETLADGLRCSLFQGRFSGNAAELSAARTGWEKISRWHGAACGGTTADEWLAGRTPGKGISSGAAGAWAEAFAACASEPGGVWASDALERLVYNALPAAGNGWLRVNRVSDQSIPDGYARVTDAAHLLGRLARGWAAAAESAVLRKPDGAEVCLLLPGAYSIRAEGQPVCRLLIQRKAAGSYAYRLTLRTAPDRPVPMILSVRVPAWAAEAEAAVGKETPVRARAGEVLCLKRDWAGETAVELNLTPALRAEDGYHQSLSVYRGPVLLCMPVSEEDGWQMAAAGAPFEKDGRVFLPLRRTPGWQRPEDVPVRPRAEGETVDTELKPFAACARRIAVFPQESAT